MAKKRKFTDCPECGKRISTDRLDAHLRAVHPKASKKKGKKRGIEKPIRPTRDLTAGERDLLQSEKRARFLFIAVVIVAAVLIMVFLNPLGWFSDGPSESTNGNGNDGSTLDSDSDGMPDAWEKDYGMDPQKDDSQGDIDNDGLVNGQEFTRGTDPRNPDSDNDGMMDGWEVTNLLNPMFGDEAQDPDEDGLANLQEFSKGTNPKKADTDGDTMPDGWEDANSLNPLEDDKAGDPDNDQLKNSDEYSKGTDPQNADTDNDGMPDGWEVTYDLNPKADDSAEDPDEDGHTNIEEYNSGTDPNPGPVEQKNRIAVVNTEMGVIKFELYEDKMPITTGKFIELVEEGYYTDKLFYRAIEDSLIQGGGERSPGGSDPDTIAFEFDPSIQIVEGLIGMASTAGGSGGSSEFFIVLDGPSWESSLYGKYAMFGKVTLGMDVAVAISHTQEPPDQYPSDPVVINTITLETPA